MAGVAHVIAIVIHTASTLHLRLITTWPPASASPKTCSSPKHIIPRLQPPPTFPPYPLPAGTDFIAWLVAASASASPRLVADSRVLQVMPAIEVGPLEVQANVIRLKVHGIDVVPLLPAAIVVSVSGSLICMGPGQLTPAGAAHSRGRPEKRNSRPC